MEWQKKAFFGICLALAYIYVPMYIQNYGAMEDVYNHEPGDCKYVEGINDGADDLHMLADGTTFISSGIAKSFNSTAKVDGKIYLYNMSHPNKKPQQLKLQGIAQKDFIPHGISLWVDPKTADMTLFVVNHHPEEDRIEQFKFDKGKMTLIHMESYTDNRLNQANDVVAVGENAFYYTNYLYMEHPLMKSMEAHMPLKWGGVYYWEKGSRPKIAVNKLKQPNGIIASANNKRIYVAHEGHQQLLMYKRCPKDNSLKLIKAYPLHTTPDNINLASNETEIWVASHAVFWKSSKMMADPNYPSPSQVLRLELAKDGTTITEVTEVYANVGSELKGSSVATFYKGKLLIGTVLHKLMLCDVAEHLTD